MYFQFEAKFAAATRDKRPALTKSEGKPKKRRVENRKIWISELQVNSSRVIQLSRY